MNSDAAKLFNRLGIYLLLISRLSIIVFFPGQYMPTNTSFALFSDYAIERETGTR